MKKLIIFILILCSLLFLVSCGKDKIQDSLPILNDRFERIYTDAGYNRGIGGVAYYRDIQTDVIYTSFGGSLCPLLNSDGTPVLYNDIEKEIK